MTSLDNEALVLLLDRLVSSSSSEDVEVALEKLLDYEGDMEQWLDQEPELIPKLQKLFLSESSQVLAARMLLKLSQQSRSLLEILLLHECRLLESAIDVASDSTNSNYARTLALQLLQRFCHIPNTSLWLSAPNGIHRIGDLLKDETVRAEVLILGTILAQWPGVAKVWIFAEIGNLVLDTAIQEGGLTGGNLMVQDCLTFLAHLLSHDANSAKLVFDSPENLPILSKLMDLRLGKEYMNPTVSDADTEDLDALLSSDGTNSKKRVVPKLLPSEEAVISKIIDIFSNVLENESLRNELSNKPIVTSLWSLALLNVGDNSDFPCAIPSSDLQCKAIALIAKHFNTVDIMNRHGGLDQLLSLVCTRPEQSMVQAILYLIRSILPDNVLNEMLMECLAPSPDTTTPASENVVRKLLITAMSQLDSEIPAKNLLIGSLSALGIFVSNDEARRSIFFRITSVECPELWTKLMTCVQRSSETDEFLSFHLWRFVVVAMSEAIVAEVLQNYDIAQYIIGSDADMAKFAIGIMTLNLPDESLCGGWTRASLLQSVQPWNNWMKALERLKQPNHTCFFFSLEESLWIDWCAEHVLKIRQGMIQEMTAGKGEEEDNPLSSIVEEQSNELKTLRAALETSQRRVDAQEKELSTWEQRMQSNPTELDELLSASTAKISALDAKIISLEDQLRDASTAHAAEVESKDSKIAELDKRIAEKEASEAESRTECGAMREEMAALSEAYTRLEDEYRLSQEKIHQQESRQTEGEESGQDGANGSTEVATLRAENQRLVEHNAEAQAWMAMADKKITEQEAELSDLRQQPQNTPSDSTSLIAKEGELLALREELAAVLARSEEEIRARDAKIEQLQSGTPTANEGAISVLREENNRLNSEALEAQKWMAMAAERIDVQEAKLSSMRNIGGDNGLSSTEQGDEFIALQEEIESLRSELAAVRLQNEADVRTRDTRIQQLESSSTPDNSEIMRLREANEAAEAWMQDAYNHHQSLANQISTLTEENNTLIDQCKLQQAELANKEALYEENSARIEDMTSQIQTLRLQIESSNPETEQELTRRCSALEAELKVEKQEVALLQSRSIQTTGAAESDKIAELEQTILSLNIEILELRSSRSELLQRVSDLETTQIEAGATKEEIEQLRIRAHEAESRKASIEKILEAVSIEKEEIAAESQKNLNRLQGIQNELSELRRKEQNTTSDSGIFDDELAELREQNQTLQREMESKEAEANDVIHDWQRSNESLQLKISTLEEEKQGLVAEKQSVLQDLHDCQRLLKERQEETASLKQQVEDLNGSVAGLQSQIENLHEQLEDQEKDNADVLQGWQDAYDEATAAGKSSQTEIEALKAKFSEVVAELQTIRNENSRLNQSLGDHGNVNETPSNQSAGEDPKAPNQEFSSVLDLRSQIKTVQEESRMAILEWQEAYEDKVEELSDMQDRFDELQSKSPSPEYIATLESRCTELETVLQRVQDERDSFLRTQTNCSDDLAKARNDISRLEQNLTEMHILLGIVQTNNMDFENRQEEAMSAIEELKQLQARYEETCVDLQSAKQRLQEMEVENMTTTNLSEQLEDQRQENEEIVRIWEESYNNVQSELECLRNEKEKELSDLREQVQSLQSTNKIQGAESCRAHEQPVCTEPQVLDKSNDSQVAEENIREATEIAAVWQRRCEEIGDELKLSRNQHEDYQKEFENAIALWEQRYNELQLDFNDLQSKYNEVVEERSTMKCESSGSFGDSDNPSTLASEVELLRSQAKESTEALVSWQESYNALKQEYDEAVARFEENSALLIEEQTKCNELEAQAKEFGRQAEENKGALGRMETLYNDVVGQLDQVRSREISQKNVHEGQLQDATSEIKRLLQENEICKMELVEIKKMFDDREGLLNKLKSDLKIAEDDLKVKTTDVEDAENIVREWEASYEDLSADFERLKALHNTPGQSTQCSNEQEVGQETISEKSGIDPVLQDYNNNETEYISKIQVLEQEQARAREAIDKEEVYLAKIEALEEDIERLELSHAKVIDGSSSQLEQLIETLQSELQSNKLQAESAIAEWDSCYQEVSAQLKAKEEQLSEANSIIQELEETVRGKADASNMPLENGEDYVAVSKPEIQHEHEAAIKSLQDTIAALEMEKKQEADHARSVIDNWGAEYEALLEELEMTQQMKETSSSQEAAIAERTQRISELQEETEELRGSLDRLLYEKSALESETKELQSQLAVRSTEVDQLRRDISTRSEIDLQQTTSDSFEARIHDLLTTSQNLQHELHMARGEKTALEIRLTSLDDNFKSQIEAEKSENARIRETLEGERMKDFTKLERLEDDLEAMRREKASWEQRCTNLSADYSNLAEELEETKNSLRLTLTDKATSEASHAAASLMKDQLENLHDKLEKIQQAMARERDAKETAEAEATRLRSNIAALLGMEDNDENKTAMEQRLMDATDSLQRMERSEISALKNSLSRTLNELSEARNSEKEMEEKAASASHRASLYEAEVVNTKNDFNFLSRTLDDIRDSEASKISSLEFRLSSVQNEHSVQTKIYAAELENLRNELSQSNLERDRLLQALNESQSNRESINQFSSPDLSSGEDNANELAQLRIEKAQLLSAATAEASHMERRLRESRARIKAAAEAEVIMERQLRLTAERSLESSKAEIEALRSLTATHAPSAGESEVVKEHLTLLQSQLDDAKSSRERLEHEIDLLQTQLSDTKRERDADVARMHEECQKLRVRINHVEREGRFEAQVIAEAARLKASESMTVAAPETKEEKSEEVIALWDHIQQLQEGIKKERTLYYEKKSEHENLLALLARHDLMKQTLSEALASVGGQEAVDAAIREASDLASNRLSL